MIPWPKLNYDAWRESGSAIHLWLQIVGKYRLAATPWLNHSWHATLYITPRGLSTGVIHHDDVAIDFEFDFVRHELVGRSSTSARPLTIALGSMSVADFHKRFIAMTQALGAPIDFHGAPNEVPEPIPFTQDTKTRPYHAEIVSQHIRALQSADRVLRTFRTGYLGKVSPVHLFWGSFDLAVTRFSGDVAPPHPGGIPALPDNVTREAYSHEVSSAGFWFGGGGIDEAAFYSYAYPTPDGFPEADVSPDEAYYFEPLGEFVLTYEAVRTSPDPEKALLSFLQSTWEAASRLGDWPHTSLECPFGEALRVRASHVPESKYDA